MVRRLGGVVVVGSLLRWRVGGSLPAFSLFWGLRSAVKPVGAFYGGVGCLYMVSGSRCVYVAQNAF